MITRLAVQHTPTQVSTISEAAQHQQMHQTMANQFHSLSPTQADQYSESASSSASFSNTDSDSLRSLSHQAISNKSSSNKNTNNNNNNNNNSKSPILIKYNYYDYNGARQEQANHDMNYQAANKVQRQLSPTFKQNLDQIVRNSQRQQQQIAKLTPPSSPEQNNYHGSASSSSKQQQQEMLGLQLARRYKLSSYEQRCLRCNKTVYQMDKVGPLKDFTFYHQNCFKCRECGTKLTLKTYFNNQQSSGDQEVYCHRHCPKTGPGKLDNQSVGIRAALNAPKVFEAAHLHCTDALIASPTSGGRLSPTMRCQQQFETPNVDSRALYIQHAVQQTRLQNIYKQSQVDKKISQFIERRLEYLEPKQKMLEMRHREEEDALFKAFETKWRQEESQISEQIRDEWQLELKKLLDKYKRQLSNISSSSPSASSHSRSLANWNEELPESRLMMIQQQTQLEQQQLSKQQMIEFERMNLEKTMTIKLDRKKETLKRKLKEFERQATAELVEKQSREMLTLISMKLDEYKEEQKRKIGSDLEQFEALESLANQLGSSLQLVAGPSQQQTAPNGANGRLSSGNITRQPALHIAADAGPQAAAGTCVKTALNGGSSQHSTPSAANRPVSGLEAPAPKPPKISKMELYNNEEPDEVFRAIDELAINVAKEDQQTFTDLVHHLTRNCLTDVEKARAIFRWITVKNLNTMHFDSSIKADTPLGLLRGIKNGSESYHVLFKRLCSYAGLHCVVIKGYSKSAGYQPGVKFEGNRFRNSWNAVYVAGAWRFVQCNWGARHLVSVAVMQDKDRPENSNCSPANKQNLNGTHLHAVQAINSGGRSSQHPRMPIAASSSSSTSSSSSPSSPNRGRRGLATAAIVGAGSGSPPQAQYDALTSAGGDSQLYLAQQTSQQDRHKHLSPKQGAAGTKTTTVSIINSKAANDSLRYEYDDHYFLTDPDEFIYEFLPLSPEWQLIKSRPITLAEFEQLPFVRSLFFKYGLYFPQTDIRSVLYTDSSGATTIKIGMPTHMIPSLIFHYNLKHYDTELEHYEGVSLKRFVMQSVESGTGDGASNGQSLLSNIVSFRVHLPQNGAYILDIFANSTTPTQYITGEPMKFKSVCKFKIIARNLKTVMMPLPDCASGEFGPMKATRLFGLIPITHESGLISIQNDKRFLEIQFRMTRPLLDFVASLHKNGYDERQLSKSIKIFIDGDIIIVTAKFFEDGQYGLDIYTRDQMAGSLQNGATNQHQSSKTNKTTNHHSNRKVEQQHHHQPTPNTSSPEPKKQLLTHCCKYLINVRTPNNR